MITGAASLLVLHEIGDAGGGDPWRDALAQAGWRGRVAAPDLPGHGGEPASIDSSYELVDPAWFALRVLRDADFGEPPAVLGVGTSGWPALLLALGGRARAVALVDGLGGPWLTAAEWVQYQRAALRAVVDDEAAMQPAPPRGFDPRARHGVVAMTDEGLARRAVAALTVPAVAVHTRDSVLGLDAVTALLAHGNPPPPVVHADARRPEAVAPAVVAWAQDR